MIMNEMDIRPATEADLDAWIQLRRALWPTLTDPDARAECRAMLASDTDVAWLGWVDDQALGMIEGRLRGGPEHLYGHVEGWYVDPAARGTGLGRALMSALSEWLLHRHIHTLFSDTNPDYPLSPAAHQAAGFEEVGRIIIFRKRLG